MKSLVNIIFLSLFMISARSQQSDFFLTLADSALTLTQQDVVYDPSYFRIDYPGGDIPENKGVCTDVIIRAYRKMGIDLQKEVHEDMSAHFDQYPSKWGHSRPDRNIDHRRVPNLMVFFKRNGELIRVTSASSDYKPGDIVCWDLGGGIPHIGLVSRIRTEDGMRYLIIHNIGAGQVVEDVLFSYRITGHFRYRGP